MRPKKKAVNGFLPTACRRLFHREINRLSTVFPHAFPQHINKLSTELCTIVRIMSIMLNSRKCRGITSTYKTGVLPAYPQGMRTLAFSNVCRTYSPKGFGGFGRYCAACILAPGVFPGSWLGIVGHG